MLALGCSGYNLWCRNAAWSKHHRLHDRKHTSERRRMFRVNVIYQCPSSLTGPCQLLQSRGKFALSYTTSLLTLATYVKQVPVLLSPHIHPLCWKKSSFLSDTATSQQASQLEGAGFTIPCSENASLQEDMRQWKAHIHNPEQEGRLYEKEHLVSVSRWQNVSNFIVSVRSGDR